MQCRCGTARQVSHPATTPDWACPSTNLLVGKDAEDGEDGEDGGEKKMAKMAAKMVRKVAKMVGRCRG